MPGLGQLRLFLLRHGQVRSNRDYRFVGDRDEPLTEVGERQAAKLADALMALPTPIGRVLASPRRRAMDTARAFASRSGLEVESDQRLTEQSYGAWEGLSRSEVRALSAEDARLLGRFDTDPGIRPPGGESLAEVQKRCVALVSDIVARVDECGPDVALFTHVGPIKALVAAAVEIPLTSARRFFLDLATITVVDWGPPGVLRLFNAHEHLGQNEARWLQRS